MRDGNDLNLLAPNAIHDEERKSAQQKAPRASEVRRSGFRSLGNQVNSAIELANKMKGTYVVAAVGDVLMQEPMGKMISPELQRLLRDADTTVGNKEHYLIDSRNWPHGHGNNWAPKELAQDLADLGFDLLAPGEGDGDIEGMKSSAYWYDRVGIQICQDWKSRAPSSRWESRSASGVLGIRCAPSWPAEGTRSQ